MSTAFPPSNPTIPASFPQAQSPSPCCPTRSSDYGFKRLIPLLESPPVGAGILAFTFFFFVAFLSDIILANITSMTLGIVVTLSTFGILGLILLILCLL